MIYSFGITACVFFGIFAPVVIFIASLLFISRFVLSPANALSFSLYSSYPINDGICSIFNIKDFDFDVLDAESKVLYNDNASVIDITADNGISGEYAEKSIFNTIPAEDEDESEESSKEKE